MLWRGWVSCGLGNSEGRRKDPRAFVLFGVALDLCLLSLDRKSCLGLGEFRGHLTTHMLLTSQWGRRGHTSKATRASFSRVCLGLTKQISSSVLKPTVMC